MRLKHVMFAAMLAISSSAHAVSLGSAAPHLEAQDQAGAWQRIEALRGKVIYVDFWASWCAPCRLVMPELDRMRRQWPDDLVVIGVNVDTKRSDALAFLKKTPVQFPIVFDPDGQWAQRFDVPGMPTGYVIDRDGVVRHINVGYQASEVTELETLIRKAVEGKP